jgi:hypothetical protein
VTLVQFPVVGEMREEWCLVVEGKRTCGCAGSAG